MFGDHYAPARQLLELVRAVAGPTHEGSRLGDARAKGQWEHRAQYRGRPLRLVLSHRHVSGSTGRLLGMFVGVPLGGRPLEFFVELSPAGAEALQLPNGAPSLLPHVAACGFPEEVVRAALDEQKVAELRAAAAQCNVRYLAAEGDWLTTFLRVETPQGLSPGPTLMPAPADLVRAFDFLQASCEHFVRSFDQAQAGVQRAQGPAVAEQWLDAQRHALQGRREQRRRGVAIAIAVTILILLAIVATIVVLVLLFS